MSQIIADTMEGLHMSYPKPTVDLGEIRRTEREAQGAGKQEPRNAKETT